MSNNNKRRRTMSYEDYSLHNPSSHSIVFTSSEQDQPSVDIITKNLTEFACLADDHGFQLSVNCETRTNVVVYVRKINSSDEYSIKKMIETLKRLVQKKKHEKTMESNMEEWKTSFEQRLQELEQKDEINDIHKKTVTKAQLKEEEIDDEDSFFYQYNFELIRKSPHILVKITERLSCDHNRQSAPFKDIVSCKEKRKELLSYFDLLQTDFDEEGGFEGRVPQMTPMQATICYFAEYNGNFQPTRERMLEITNEMKRKFNLLDNIVGTVHVEPVRLDYGTWNLVVIIVDKYIMLANVFDFRFEEELVDDVLFLRSDFRDMSEWAGLKLATKLPLKPEDQEGDEEAKLFVRIENPEVYKENEKVITFIKRNFFLRGWHTSTIACFYNLCYDYY